MRKTMVATRYRTGCMESLGNAMYALIRQHDFPFEYDEKKDAYTSADHDRCFQWDYAHAKRCFKEHTGTGDMGFEQWVRNSHAEEVMAFLKDILKVADLDAKGVFGHPVGDSGWTGFRILGTVHRGNGYPVWSLELFAKGKGSKTKVYGETDFNPPNLEPGPKRRLMMGGRGCVYEDDGNVVFGGFGFGEEAS
jgi:hypothetical protein